MKFLLVGLGNIGPEYELTRHNIGFLVMDRLADKFGVKFKLDRLAYTADFTYKGKHIFLIKPTTYMNLSGKAVRYWLTENKIATDSLMVVTDDLALPYGKLRIKPKGSNGGHNGLGNIQELLTTDVYPRLRFGVGDNFSKGKQIDFVLSQFTKDESAELLIHIDRACDAMLAFCSQGIALAMNEYNK